MHNIERLTTNKLIDYKDSIKMMEQRIQEIYKGTQNELIWFLNHTHIYTQGTSASKKEIINLGLDNQVNFKETWTCYEGKDLACGYCTACSSRIQGFLDNKMKDPIEYERTDIPW